MHLLCECTFKDGNEDKWAILHKSSYLGGRGLGDVYQTIRG